jgi:hypothetical protein
MIQRSLIVHTYIHTCIHALATSQQLRHETHTYIHTLILDDPALAHHTYIHTYIHTLATRQRLRHEALQNNHFPTFNYRLGWFDHMGSPRGRHATAQTCTVYLRVFMTCVCHTCVSYCHSHNNLVPRNGLQRFLVPVYYWKAVEIPEIDPQLLWEWQQYT